MNVKLLKLDVLEISLGLSLKFHFATMFWFVCFYFLKTLYHYAVSAYICFILFKQYAYIISHGIRSGLSWEQTSVLSL